MKTNKIEDVINEIKKGKNFAIFVHISPDPDAIGSGLALINLLENLGKQGHLFCDDKEPDSTNFLFDGFCRDDSIITSCDTLVYIDQGLLNRSGKYYKYVKENKNIIVIDHHISADEEGNVIYRDNSSSSTAEIVYKMFQSLNMDIDEKTELCLYSGIATDTGCFIHSNTTPLCHKVAFELLSKGIDLQKAHYELFIKKPSNYMKIQKYVFKHFQVFGNTLTLVTINNRTFKKLGCPDSYIIIDALSYYTTDVLIIVTEREKNTVKINARSRNYDVQRLCAKFSGGGHSHAAGANSPYGFKTTISLIKKQILK